MAKIYFAYYNHYTNWTKTSEHCQSIMSKLLRSECKLYACMHQDVIGKKHVWDDNDNGSRYETQENKIEVILVNLLIQT